jgi:hypothetical protein
LTNAIGIIRRLDLFKQDGTERHHADILDLLNGMVVQGGGAYYSVEFLAGQVDNDKIFDLEGSYVPAILSYLLLADYELMTLHIRYKNSPLTMLKSYLRDDIDAAAAADAASSLAASPAPAAAAAAAAAGDDDDSFGHSGDYPPYGSLPATLTPVQSQVTVVSTARRLTEKEAAEGGGAGGKAAEGASVAGGAGGKAAEEASVAEGAGGKVGIRLFTEETGRSRKYHNKKTRKSNKPSSSRKSRKV